MMINCKNAVKVAMEGKSPCATYRKSVSSKFILYPFCRCWVHKTCSGIRGKLKKNSEFKCETCSNQLRDIAEKCPGV